MGYLGLPDGNVIMVLGRYLLFTWVLMVVVPARRELVVPVAVGAGGLANYLDRDRVMLCAAYFHRNSFGGMLNADCSGKASSEAFSPKLQQAIALSLCTAPLSLSKPQVPKAQNDAK